MRMVFLLKRIRANRRHGGPADAGARDVAPAVRVWIVSVPSSVWMDSMSAMCRMTWTSPDAVAAERVAGIGWRCPAPAGVVPLR
jgi:hypothetical protein